MTATTDEYGNAVDDEWTPESPVLRGEVRTPDDIISAPKDAPLDELPHRIRAAHGLTDPNPDPGYDPEEDDLL